jgi:neutral trehalase
MKNYQARIYFEIHYQSPISDSGWYRIKRALRESGLDINEHNLQLVAELKRKTEYTKLSLNQLIYCYQQAQNIANKLVSVKGDLAYKELKKISGGKAHRATVIRWFQSVNKKDGRYFDRNRDYEVEELVPVFAAACLYVQKALSNKLPSFK